ncbi:MAG: hypothetical protein IBX52_01955 [Bacterioplanes sp.]|nr:hypothetical protein [Bacterioplanes sp.]
MILRADRVRQGWRTRTSTEGFTASQRVKQGNVLMGSSKFNMASERCLQNSIKQQHRAMIHRADRVRQGWRTRASMEGFTASQRVKQGNVLMRSSKFNMATC